MTADALVPGYSRLTLTNEASAPALACAHVRQVAQQAGFDADELAAIELGVEEATSNVVRHAYHADELHGFEVICRPTALGLEICIRDQGLPFDPGLLPDYRPDSPPQDQLGLGTFLMKQSFDEVVFHNLGHLGKETCLVKHRSHRPIAAYAAAPPSAAARGATAAATITVRSMRAAEAIEVARCVYEAYEYSYPYEHIYYPERVAALNASGELQSAVAVTEQGEIAGHAALIFDPASPGVAEFGIVVTKPEFRGLGVAGRLGEFLVQGAREQGLAAIYTQAVTSHAFTQQFCHALGFRDCALLPGHAPASLKFRHIAEQLPQRETLVLALRSIRPADPPSIHPPAKHREMILELYRSLDIAPNCADSADAVRAAGNTELSVRTKSGLDLAVIDVRRAGADLEEALRRQLLHLRRQHLAVVELALPLCDPGMAPHLPGIEAMGFFFTGLSPLRAGGDAMLMHCLIDPAIDYDNIHVHSPVAQALLDYVRRADPNREDA